VQFWPTDHGSGKGVSDVRQVSSDLEQEKSPKDFSTENGIQETVSQKPPFSSNYPLIFTNIRPEGEEESAGRFELFFRIFLITMLSSRTCVQLSSLFNRNNRSRTEVDSINSAPLQFLRGCPLGTIFPHPEFPDDLAERIIGILFKKSWASFPACTAAHAVGSVNNHFHDTCPLRTPW